MNPGGANSPSARTVIANGLASAGEALPRIASSTAMSKHLSASRARSDSLPVTFIILCVG